MQKKISLIIARNLLKVATKEEKEILSNWVKKSKGNAVFAKTMEAYWEANPEAIPDKRLNLSRERLFARMDSIPTNPKNKSLIFYLTRIAAAVIIIVSIASLSVFIASESGLFYPNQQIEILTQAGQQRQVILPDGTLAWLNAETKIEYTEEKNNRKVSLSGEAYFEVAHAFNRPFLVETDNTKVRVLGTKFNVLDYPDSEITEVSLLSGKISMSLPGYSDDIVVSPGEKIMYNAEKSVFSRKLVDVQNEILWQQGILIFKNELFEGLLRKLERHYNVKFIYNEETISSIHYSGTIDNLDIDKVLDFINLTIPIKYEIENNTIKLYLVNMKN